MRIVCMSDTHNCNEQVDVPDGDLLIHSGDATTVGSAEQIREFNNWFGSLPHSYKIFIAGNHDWLFERDNERARSLLDPRIVYLQDSFTFIEGLKIYGAPWQPRFYDWAFNLMRGDEIAEKWKLIPEDIDILITHGPPHRILDTVSHPLGDRSEGCEELRSRVEAIAANGRLKLHVFGHIHSGYGVHEDLGITFVNASTCDEDYAPTQPPIVIDL